MKKPKNKNCLVICTFFGERRSHPHNTKEAITINKSNIDYLKKLDSGTSSDIIICNHTCPKNQDPERQGLKFLSKINGTKTKNGKIITISRPWGKGYGLGFKSFDYAFSKFKNDYDYWFFCEDDFAQIIKDQYFSTSINQLKKLKNKNVAFLCAYKGYLGGANVPRSKKISDDSDFNSKSQPPIHCHGGIGCTHRDYLNVIVKKYGSLPYSKDAQYEEISGEVNFTNIFIQNSYNIALMEDCYHL